ncbi:hypothetical protein C5167_046665 [Papaver somniferum]|uniref:Enhancer of polycomb-like protein n=1 Tax=Papaver somniferum TaxID=3469 RepID=A0A4Y7LI51_PAPSO|nr:hypothetical protein C5167_046665 [Papaver somniferum]
MPSVGMRRSTRILVPKSVKDFEGATVLRSGKRLSSPLFVDSKAARGNEIEWFSPSMVEKSCGVVVPSFHHKSLVKRNEFVAKQIKKESSSPSKKLNATVTVIDEPKKNKMYGNGYGRKRLRSVAENVVGTLTDSNRKLDFDFEKRGLDEERKYGIHFFRKHRRKAVSSESSAYLAIEHSDGNNEFSKINSKSEELAGNSGSLSSESRDSLDVIVEPSPCCSSQFCIFLVSLLNFMTRARVSVSKLVAFMCSGPIGETFSRHGIHFFPDLSCRSSGTTFLSRICIIWGAQDFVPMFSLNFNSAPFTFISLHFRMLLQSQSSMDVLERYLVGVVMKPHGANGSRKRLSSEMVVGVSLSKIVASVSSSAKRRKEVNSVAQRRISSRRRTNSRGVKTFRSLRFKRPPTLVSQECVDEVSDMFGTGVDGTDTSSINKVKKPLSSGTCSADIIEETNQKGDTICCSANVLVTESDKCFRAEGAKIVLEYSESDDWLLVVKVQGVTRFIHKAVDLMRPLCTTNRFTHDLIWIGRTDWRLEFSDRQDWSIFKELHSECADRNMKAMAARVHEVESHGDYKNVSFVRPNAYIKMHGNEVERLFVRRIANYDMDTDDEEWLGKLNNDLCGDGGPLRLVSAENFEKMVDIFEKAAYCKPDDVSDESKAVKLCPDMTMNILTSVYHYWVEKRKKKNCALLRVLQIFLQKETLCSHINFALSLRKGYTLLVHASNLGFLNNVFAEEQEQDANRKRSAKISVELAVVKRRRAQELIEIADLATYKATLALKIAEAVQHEIPSDDFVTFILS